MAALFFLARSAESCEAVLTTSGSLGRLGGGAAGVGVSSVRFFLVLSSDPFEGILVTVGSFGLFCDGEDGVGVGRGCAGCIGTSGDVYSCRLCGLPGLSLGPVVEVEDEVDVGGV